MTNDKSPTPAVERTMGMCCAACTPSHKTPHVEQKICVDWKPLAPSDSQGTKPDEKCAINMCVYPSVILCDLLKGHEGMHSATIASYPAPLLNSVDTPAPVPERTNGELNERSIRCESGGSISVDSLRAVGVGDVLQVAAPVPEPEGEILESSTRKDEGAIVSGTASSGEFVEPPARKDELGTCQHNDLPHIKWGCCDDWTPVAPQASPEACKRCGLSLVDWLPVINIRQGIGFHISRIDETRPQLRCETSMSCMICGQVRDKAIVHEPSGAYVCMDCRESARRGQVASPEHDLRKQDTPESKEHWDFVAEATARVEAMPEWKKNSVAVGSPEAPAKEERMPDVDRIKFEIATNEDMFKDFLYSRNKWHMLCTAIGRKPADTCVADITDQLARLGLSGRAE